MITTPFASLLVSDKQARIYQVRFNEPCKKSFDGAKFCYVKATDNRKYIVFIPIREVMAEKTAMNSRICYERGKAVRVSLNKYVSNGMIKASAFGKRYKVKKDKRGWIYVCLQEELEVDGI